VNSRLKALSARDFRSIRGEVSVSLDAPVVLMHGPNGAGKTSLLSAIELALTGAVPSLRRAEPDYIAYLPHKSADEGHVALEMSDENGAMRRAELLVTREGVRNAPLLDEDAARFSGERCYLAQSTLGRLLEIYQLQDTRRSDSPLTRFVKDLLGLDRMEAVIDGLHSAGDVRRLRDPVPSYWAAREDIPKLQAELNTAAAERDRLVAEESEIAAGLRQRLEQLDAELVLLLDRPAELASRLAISPRKRRWSPTRDCGAILLPRFNNGARSPRGPMPTLDRGWRLWRRKRGPRSRCGRVIRALFWDRSFRNYSACLRTCLPRRLDWNGRV
jgi:DNA repair protein SbcC/Rad50